MPSQKCAPESTFHRIHERLNLSENIPPQSLTIDFSTSTPQRCAGPLVIPLHRPCHRIFPISQVFLRTLVKKSLSKQQNFYCVMSIQILWLASWFPHALNTKVQVFLWWWSCLKELWPFPVASHGCGTVTMGFAIEKSVKAVNAAFEMSVCNRNACLTQGRRSKIRGLEKLVVSNNVSKWGGMMSMQVQHVFRHLLTTRYCNGWWKPTRPKPTLRRPKAQGGFAKHQRLKWYPAVWFGDQIVTTCAWSPTPVT